MLTSAPFSHVIGSIVIATSCLAVPLFAFDDLSPEESNYPRVQVEGNQPFTPVAVPPSSLPTTDDRPAPRLPYIGRELSDEERQQFAVEEEAWLRKLKQEEALKHLENFRNTRDAHAYYHYRQIVVPTKDDIPELVELMGDPSIELSSVAVGLLGKLGPDAAPVVPTIIERCRREGFPKDANRFVNSAVRAFGEIGPQASAATPYMIELYEECVRRYPYFGEYELSILQAWTKMGDGAKAAIPLLEAQLANVRPALFPGDELPFPRPVGEGTIEASRYFRSISLSTNVYIALGTIRNEPPLTFEQLLRADTEIYCGRNSFRALQSLRESILPVERKVEILANVIKSKPSHPIHVYALDMLSEFEYATPASLEAAIESHAASSMSVQNPAMNAIFEAAKCPNADLAPIWTAQLDSPSTPIFSRAVGWLNRHGGDNVIPKVISALEANILADDYQNYKVMACIEYLRAKGPKAAEAYPVLKSMLDKNCPVYQRDVSRGRPIVIRAYVLLVMSETHMKEEIRPIVVDMLANGQGYELAAAAKVAAAFPSERERFLPLLLRPLQKDFNNRVLIDLRYISAHFGFMTVADTSIRLEAIRAIVAIGGEEAKIAIPLLRERAQDTREHHPNPEYIDAAAEAVEILSR